MAKKYTYNSYEKYKSAIRRLNAKIVNAEKAFGKGSELATKIKHDIGTLIPREALRFNKSGTLQITTSKELYQKFGTDYLQKAEQVQSAQDYQIKAKGTHIKFPSDWFGGVEHKDVVKRANLMAELQEFIRDVIPTISEGKDERSQKALTILRKKGRRSYEELEQVMIIMRGEADGLPHGSNTN